MFRITEDTVIVAEAESLAAARVAVRTLMDDGFYALLHIEPPDAAFAIEWYVREADGSVTCRNNSLVRKYDGRA